MAPGVRGQVTRDKQVRVLQGADLLRILFCCRLSPSQPRCPRHCRPRGRVCGLRVRLHVIKLHSSKTFNLMLMHQQKHSVDCHG